MAVVFQQTTLNSHLIFPSSALRVHPFDIPPFCHSGGAKRRTNLEVSGVIPHSSTRPFLRLAGVRVTWGKVYCEPYKKKSPRLVNRGDLRIRRMLLLLHLEIVTIIRDYDTLIGGLRVKTYSSHKGAKTTRIPQRQSVVQDLLIA